MNNFEELLSKLERNLKLPALPATFPSLEHPPTIQKHINWSNLLFPTPSTAPLTGDQLAEEVLKYQAAVRLFDSNLAKLNININKLEARISEEKGRMMEAGVYPRLLRVGEGIEDMAARVEARDNGIKALVESYGKCVETGNRRLEVLGSDRYRGYTVSIDSIKEKVEIGGGKVEGSGNHTSAT
ncbi:hypothetical protein TWF694_005725 [Orbilia ellipsospora]|uniref:Uncharacterized protein n=1 Tax=Orbilia ellipsospora TaxID=2528407 RepID=A0AAV9WRS9_9PEZI